MSKLETYIEEASNPSIPKTMQAVRLHGKGFEGLKIEEIPVPEPGPDQLLARVDAAGVCTSILKILSQGSEHKYLNGWDPSKWPLTLGDEGSITLVKIGENLKDKYKPGERYGIQPAVDVGPINHRKRYNDNAEGMNKVGVGYTAGGQLAEYFIVGEEILAGNCMISLPEQDIPYYSVSMTEPISCVVSAHTRHVHIYKDAPDKPRYAKLGIKEGGTCVVVGVGSMGKIHVELAMRYKPKNLIAVDPIEKNRDWVNRVLGPKAKERGINLHAVSSDDAEAFIKKVSGGAMADDIIMAVGIRKVQNEAMKWLGFGGVANLFGGLKKGDSLLELDNIRVHYDEIKVAGSSGGDPHDYIETLDAIKKGDIDPGNYVAGVGSLDNAIKVLHMIEKNEVQGKVILYPHIKQMDLKIVDSWSRDEEKSFLEEHLK